MFYVRLELRFYQGSFQCDHKLCSQKDLFKSDKFPICQEFCSIFCLAVMTIWNLQMVSCSHQVVLSFVNFFHNRLVHAIGTTTTSTFQYKPPI